MTIGFPGDAIDWTNKGCVLGQLGETDQAIECFDKALEINPRDAEVWASKGIVLGDLGKFDQAIECYDKLLEINPTLAKKSPTRNRNIDDKYIYHCSSKVTNLCLL